MPLELDWLQGEWVGHVWGGQMEEHWTAPSGGSMLGMNRHVREGKTPHIEFMTVRTFEEKTTMAVYLVREAGKSVEPIEYALAEQAPCHAVFRNPSHARLSQIVYKREGDALTVDLEGVRNSQPYREQIVLARKPSQGV